jgi:hypothetical protein
MAKPKTDRQAAKLALNGQAPTREEYGNFQAAFDWFNTHLFDGELPHCLITLQRHPRYGGYYSHKKFESRMREGEIDEIALNPNCFKDRSDAWIISVLVHEMAHEWQYRFGKPSRRGYHNREWADRMESLGLMPSDTGEPGGKRTGQRCSHYIIAGGPYETNYQKLTRMGFVLNWQSKADCNHRGPVTPSKVKFTCPSCGANIWGKPDTEVACLACVRADLREELIPYRMESE